MGFNVFYFLSSKKTKYLYCCLPLFCLRNILVLNWYPCIPWGCRSGRYVWEDHRPRSGMWKGTSGGEVISFSGCDDHQTSADTAVMFHDLLTSSSFVHKHPSIIFIRFHWRMNGVINILCWQALSKVTSTGAMTFSFIQAIEREQATTYGNMLTLMRSTISNRESNAGGGVVTTLLTMLLTGGSLGSIRQVSLFLQHRDPISIIRKLNAVNFYIWCSHVGKLWKEIVFGIRNQINKRFPQLIYWQYSSCWMLINKHMGLN